MRIIGFGCDGDLNLTSVTVEEDGREYLFENPRWISVEERLPEAKLAVLVLAYDSMYCKGVIKRCLSVHVGYTRGEDEGWFDWHSGSWLDAAYWLPTDVLPEPPEGE